MSQKHSKTDCRLSGIDAGFIGPIFAKTEQSASHFINVQSTTFEDNHVNSTYSRSNVSRNRVDIHGIWTGRCSLAGLLSFGDVNTIGAKLIENVCL